MEKVYEIIREWHEEKRIVEREERVSKAFIEFFGVEPSWVGIENKKAVAYRFVKLSDLPSDIKEKVEEIVATEEDDFEVSGIELITTESDKEDMDWTEELGCPDHGYALKRSMVKDGFEYIVSIRYTHKMDC